MLNGMTYLSHIILLRAKLLRLIVIFAVLTFISGLVAAQEGEGEGEAAVVTGTQYIPIDPALVTNYGSTDRLRYVKVDVSLKVDGGDGTAQVQHHMPAIIDTVLTILSQQNNETISSLEGKEAMRASALEKISAFLVEEDGENFVQEILFTSFVAHTL